MSEADGAGKEAGDGPDAQAVDSYLREVAAESSWRKDIERQFVLEEKQRRMAENTALKRQNEELKIDLETQKSDAKDIYYYLHKKLDDNYEVIDSLERKVLKLNQDAEQTAEDTAEKIKNIELDAAKTQSRLEDSIEKLQDELASLKEFKEHKLQIEAKLKEVMDELVAEKDARKAEVEELVRRNLTEKERLKKEMLVKIKETKQNLLSMTEDQLHTTTKRTIMENEQMTTELQYQSRETERLLKRSEAVEKANKDLKRQLQIHEEAEREYAKKTHFYQKLIKKLHEKLKSSSSADEDEGIARGFGGTPHTANVDKRSRSSSRSAGGGVLRKRRGMISDSSEASITMGRRSSQEHHGTSGSGAGGGDAVVAMLQSKAGALELNLEQVCADLKASRSQVARLEGELERMMGKQGINYKAMMAELACFIAVCLDDVKHEAAVAGLLSGISVTRNESSAMAQLPRPQREAALDRLLYLVEERLEAPPAPSSAATGTAAGGSSAGGASAGSTSPATRSRLAKEFQNLFIVDGPEPAQTPQRQVEQASIGVQTDSAPITVLKSVDIGPSPAATRSFLSEYMADETPTNRSEGVTSRILRGSVREWGKPSSTFGIPHASSTSTFLKRRTGFGGAGSSIVSSTSNLRMKLRAVLLSVGVAVSVFSCSSAGVVFLFLPNVEPFMRAAWRMWAQETVQIVPFLVELRYYLRAASKENGVEGTAEKKKKKGNVVADRDIVTKWLKNLHWMVISGVFLGLHFATWCWSLVHTTLAHSLMWVSVYPVILNWGQWSMCALFAILGSAGIGNRARSPTKPSLLETAGSITALIGAVLMLGDAFSSDSAHHAPPSPPVAQNLSTEVQGSSEGTSAHIVKVPTVEGDLSAFAGAATMCAYLVVGKSVRKWCPIWLYMFPVVLMAAITCTLASLIFEEGSRLTGLSTTSAFGFFAPQFILFAFYLGGVSGVMGHTLVNALLRYISPLLISAALLMEPLVGSLLGAAAGVQGLPGVYTFLGGPVVLVGLLLILYGERAALDIDNTEQESAGLECETHRKENERGRIIASEELKV
eukprot:g3133.t1